ncbi:hypothetical protein BOTBODRAFT_37118 [Botryobasidium botryosum FD-172 SS1]|uniref:Uncharacterized protein n=1 Tax=Botryobasidium botryosum (strain FD-172 SS1) TaxID=930990 RepID=A0A067MCS0_BOTB1|nr:hypothetical protein BOTBODRAFT_37118 [Botryobasidium botryosum FD-172 SS1]
MSAPNSLMVNYLQIHPPDGRILNITTYNGKPTLCVNDGSTGTKWTITFLPDQSTEDDYYYTIKADDGSYICPAPAGSEINLHRRTDFAYPWTLVWQSNRAYKIVDKVSGLALGLLNTNGIQLVPQEEGLHFDLLPA